MLDDGELAVQFRVNIWLIGRDEDTQAVLKAFGPRLQQPILTRRAGEALVLPSAIQRIGTLVLADVGSLTLADQRRLHAWLDDHGDGVRVITTSRESITRLIGTNGFIEPLYYRLNTVVLECRGGGVA